jgi:hypothetical protein
MPNVQEGEKGTIIRIEITEGGVPKPVPAATKKEVWLFDPVHGGRVTLTAAFTTDGNDGLIEVTTPKNLLYKGKWPVVGYVELGTRDIPTVPGYLVVGGP